MSLHGLAMTWRRAISSFRLMFNKLHCVDGWEAQDIFMDISRLINSSPALPERTAHCDGTGSTSSASSAVSGAFLSADNWVAAGAGRFTATPRKHPNAESGL